MASSVLPFATFFCVSVLIFVSSHVAARDLAQTFDSVDASKVSEQPYEATAVNKAEGYGGYDPKYGGFGGYSGFGAYGGGRGGPGGGYGYGGFGPFRGYGGYNPGSGGFGGYSGPGNGKVPADEPRN